MKESPSESIKLISTESQSKPSSCNSTPDITKKESNLSKDLTVDLNPTITDSDSSDVSISSSKNIYSSSDTAKENSHGQGRWTQKEHALFLEGLMWYGNEWKNVQRHIKTRSATQARSHAQKFFIKMRKELIDESDFEIVKEKICAVFQKNLGDKFKIANVDDFISVMKKLIFTSDTISYSTVSAKKYQKKKKKSIDSNTNESMNATVKKSVIFTISKDSSRKASMNTSSKTKETSPYSVDFVNINTLNSSENIFNQMMLEEKQSDPFNIQFDGLIENNKDNEYEDNNNDVMSLLNCWN